MKKREKSPSYFWSGWYRCEWTWCPYHKLVLTWAAITGWSKWPIEADNKELETVAMYRTTDASNSWAKNKPISLNRGETKATSYFEELFNNWLIVGCSSTFSWTSPIWVTNMYKIPTASIILLSRKKSLIYCQSYTYQTLNVKRNNVAVFDYLFNWTSDSKHKFVCTLDYQDDNIRSTHYWSTRH